MISALPGLLLALAIAKWLRFDHPVKTATGNTPRWSELLRSRNLLLATLAILFAMAGIFVISAMVPLYLTQELKLDTRTMGFVMSAIGFGGFCGSFGISALSDRIGRRPAALLSFAAASVSVYVFSLASADPTVLFCLLFLVSVFALGLLGLLTGPIATESAPAGLVASAVGLVSGVGEIVGGGLAPVIAGSIAQHYGLASTLDFALGGFLCGGAVILWLVETAPACLKAPAGTLTAAVRSEVTSS
jgi:predicted MFS family arabinose efflux permease